MTTHSYKDLIVWQKSIQAVKAAYSLIAQLPIEEKYALANRMRRAAVSIPSNIAEDQKRRGKTELSYFCGIALGSVAELETQAILCHELYNLNSTRLLSSLEEISKMLTALIKILRASA